jgi:hypothetical protein
VFGVTEGVKICRCDAKSIPFMCSYSGYSKDYMIHPNPFFTSSEDTSCKREVDLSLRVRYLHFNVRFPLHVFDVIVMW